MKNLLLLSLLFIGFTTFSQETYAVGDQIQGNWKGNGTWYNGKIGKVDGDKYFINYNDGDTEWTTAEFIRKKPEKKIVWPENTCADKETKFKEGDKIDIEENGKWYDGTVLKSQNGQYYVHYDGWSSSYDLVVNNERVRARTDKGYTGPGTSGGGSSSSNSGTKTRAITIENTCDRDVTMYINDTEYDLRPGQ